MDEQRKPVMQMSRSYSSRSPRIDNTGDSWSRQTYFDGFILQSKAIHRRHRFLGVFHAKKVDETIAETLTSAFVSHEFTRFDRPNWTEEIFDFILCHRLRKIIDNQISADFLRLIRILVSETSTAGRSCVARCSVLPIECGHFIEIELVVVVVIVRAGHWILRIEELLRLMVIGNRSTGRR